MSKWQPIETAPKEGVFLIANARGEVCSFQMRSEWQYGIINNMPGFQDWTYGEKITHWMQLPDPPSEGEVK